MKIATEDSLRKQGWAARGQKIRAALPLFAILCLSAPAGEVPGPLPDRSLPSASEPLLADADAALKNRFTFQGVSGTPKNGQDSSFYNWKHRGPNNDKEWAWFLNRHRYFEALYIAYEASGDDRYAKKIFQILSDWLEQHGQPPGHITFSSSWRALEAARRILESWDLVFLKLWEHPDFSPALKKSFVASLDAHGDYLVAHHAFSGNHLITEMLALLKLAGLRPDAVNSSIWREYALEQLEQAYSHQFYPAGTHKELSTHYQRVVILNFERLLQILRADPTDKQLEIWEARVERMWSYLAATRKPNGYAPLNNDSDLENIDTLFRHEGRNLGGLPKKSDYFDRAGQVVFRSDLPGGRPLWAFFDIGPRGTAHQHEDHLHLSLNIGGRDLLVDNGRYNYVPGPWRSYFHGPRAHNLLLVDGKAAAPKPNQADGPLPGSGYRANATGEAAWGSSTFRSAGGSEIARWRRNAVLIEGIGLLVLDQLITFQPRIIEGFWHAHPNCRWQQNERGYILSHGSESVLLSFASSSDTPNRYAVQTGRSKDPIQGWYSPRFNQKAAAPALVYQTTVSQPTILGWLFSSRATPDESAALTELKSIGKNEFIFKIVGLQGEQIYHAKISKGGPQLTVLTGPSPSL